MVGQIIAALRRSPLVKELEVLEVIEEESVQFLRVKAEIVDGSLLYVREAFFPDHSKYSYHWQTRTGEMLIRWDNAPHHPEISTHPDHKHAGEQVRPSSRVSVEEALAELSEALKRKGKIK
ncbi:MAG: hypothetical protein A3F84_23370 [Candidatus Handelsmanbacteria bacterium RIFCSPLOWO2_12_FULL_64_10]|uniref:Uncharacterized protein n=1 Tax=Handelsmanbacteria sp. (strain RIFCSPLOWO2_12_FULL_64_10) TaxID=1817868 RepID=A0A1F6CTT0_HANXR|nr:MAG: hypothetical protein A3F84_23370 [Candidatus Handelsmanbacteria bacterium RIFCSPLOWO2_12_FULL_64_10]